MTKYIDVTQNLRDSPINPVKADTETYGVYVHSNGPHGGFVVRTQFNGWCPSPYNNAEPVKVYKRKNAAQKFADSLNLPLFGRPA